MKPPTKNQWLFAGAAVLVLLCATFLLDNPKPWLPWPTHQALIAFLSDNWPARVLPILLIVPVLYLTSLSVIWNARHLAAIVLGASLLFSLLSAVYLIGSWPYGLRWQGLSHTLIVTSINVIGVSLVLALAWAGFRRKSRQLSVAAYFGAFAMLSWCAFPYLGELP